MAEFQEKISFLPSEWAIRYGENLDGWWFDGLL
jgi:hypothetical protein